MRADRLVATLLFLQERGRVTSAEVAAELEVSERTARRDLEALAASGVPVYSRQGRGGGWELVGGARTNLTGLTAEEIRSLFVLLGPVSDTPRMRTALRKLVRALPSTLRTGAEAASRVGLDDGTDWARTAEGGGPHLAELERAVLDRARIRLGYAPPGGAARDRTVDPLGLVAKAGARYLVAGTDRGPRTFRVSRVTSVERTGEAFEPPEGFDLAAAWRELAGPLEERMAAATVRGRAAPGTAALLDRLLGGRLRLGEPGDDGWIRFEADGPSPEVVAAQLAGLGARVEVLAPEAARRRLVELAAELAGLYGPA